MYTDPISPDRDLFVDGGTPSGKKKSTDSLHIFYILPRPKIIQSAATQDPDAGIVDLDYGHRAVQGDLRRHRASAAAQGGNDLTEASRAIDWFG